MDDIEDMALPELQSERSSQNEVVPKWQKFSEKRIPKEKPIGHIPGTETIYVRTWGCSHNNSDGEYMAGQLAEYGYRITRAPEEADLWVLNSCTVKNPSQDHFLNTVKRGQEQGKKVVLAGCVPQAQPSHKAMQDLSIIGVQQIDRVVEVVEETLKGNTVRFLREKKVQRKEQRRGKEKIRKVRAGGADLNLPKIRKNPYVEIVPINTGCLNQCTYCKTKHARGNLASYPPEEIINRIKHVVNEEGITEIWLTSEDTGTYGRDIGRSLPELLWGIVEQLPDGVMLRLGMTNPPYILEHLEQVAKILNHPRVYSFLHVPVQAASDHVLEDMKREYTRDEFCRVVDYLKEQVPGVTIATDIICGFPTETAKDFEETMALVRKYKFPVLHISQFYPRPGTPAARMKRVDTAEVKKRSRMMTRLFESYETYSWQIGTVERVLVTEESKDREHFVAHNKSYEQVLVPKWTYGSSKGERKKRDLMGKMFEVTIVSTGKHYLKGKVVEESLKTMPARPPPSQLHQVLKQPVTLRKRKKGKTEVLPSHKKQTLTDQVTKTPTLSTVNILLLVLFIATLSTTGLIYTFDIL